MEWSPTAVSGPDGKFTINDLCTLGMKLTARKDGYESDSHEYIVSAGSSVSIVMYKLGEYIVSAGRSVSIHMYKLYEYIVSAGRSVSILMYKLGEYIVSAGSSVSILMYKLGEYIVSAGSSVSIDMYKLGEYIVSAGSSVSIVMYKLCEYIVSAGRSVSIHMYKLGEYIVSAGRSVSILMYQLGEYIVSAGRSVSILMYQLGEYIVSAGRSVSILMYQLGEYIVSAGRNVSMLMYKLGEYIVSAGRSVSTLMYKLCEYIVSAGRSVSILMYQLGEYSVSAGSSVSMLMYKLCEYIVSAGRSVSMLMYKLGEYIAIAGRSVSMLMYKLCEYIVSAGSSVSMLMYKLGEYIVSAGRSASMLMYKLCRQKCQHAHVQTSEYIVSAGRSVSILMYQLGEYSVSAGRSVSIDMYKLEKPVFTEEPLSAAVFEGGRVKLSCKATAEPPVTQYDWFKDGNILTTEFTTSGSDLEMFPATMDNAGQYVCRATSPGGKVFSRTADIIVKGADATDTCDENPQDLVVELPPTCRLTVGGASVTSVNVGRCSKEPCATKAAPDKTGLCCGPSSTRQLHVECAGFNYDVNQVVACGCAECDNDNQVTVTGEVLTGGVSSSGVYAFYDGQRYGVSDDRFTFEATPQAGHISFQVKSSSFMPRQVTLDVMPGVTEMFVDVSLTPKPTPKVVDPKAGGELAVESGLPTAVSVTIPPNSFQDENGDPVSGDVNVYLTFADPRQPDGLDSAPGELLSSTKRARLACCRRLVSLHWWLKIPTAMRYM
ncbi:hypothetical protein NP493_523g00001 [Ridgeia piscesae]|uniref:Ig-like domain-containing protein n=1 Tax=Ridgeia piscesae TaxID=27915 RepID=A0AAD9KWG5_RIDPI|nr:hypothetical protein NP493_523g00001 [Ridgeia piscesae]